MNLHTYPIGPVSMYTSINKMLQLDPHLKPSLIGSHCYVLAHVRYVLHNFDYASHHGHQK